MMGGGGVPQDFSVKIKSKCGVYQAEISDWLDLLLLISFYRNHQLWFANPSKTLPTDRF